MDSFPPGSPEHREIHYAFKYYAVRWAKEQGHRFVAWLDSACQAVASPDLLFDRIADYGHCIITGGDVLGEWISDQALAHFGYSREKAFSMLLTGGCVVGLDFDNPRSVEFFNQWGALAQTKLFVSAHSKYAPDRMRSLLVSDHDENLVVSDDPRVKGHRSDEACFALLIDRLGMRDTKLGEWAQWFTTGY